MSRRTLLPWLIAVALAAFTGRTVLGHDPTPATGKPLNATIIRVVDGDTVVARTSDGQTERVRYIGMDTPEDVKPGVPVQCYALAAAAANRRLVANQPVKLVPGQEPHDRYGRL